VPELRQSRSALLGGGRLTGTRDDFRLREALRKFQKTQSMKATERANKKRQRRSITRLDTEAILFPLSGFRGGVEWSTPR
jgi:hypothetical protein